MIRTLTLLCVALIASACTLESRQSRVCYETQPYDYSNLPVVGKGAQAPSVPTFANCPAAVTDVLARERRCDWWYGERKSLQTQSMLNHYRCDSIDDEIGRIKQQYQHDPVIQRVLDNASIDTVI